MRDTILKTLAELGISVHTVTPIREKDGILAAAVDSPDGRFVVKYFADPASGREIANYRRLREGGVPTLPVIAQSDAAIVLPDVNFSRELRLGLQEDLDDPIIAEKLAAWYKKLHACEAPAGLYDENDAITRKNLQKIAAATHTEALPVWQLLSDHFDVFRARIDAVPRTLTYNDFYYTNLITARDRSDAMMFDYHLLGRGYVYADLRNVCSSLTPRARDAFLAAYGAFSADEAAVDAAASVLVTLHAACCRACFPHWAKESLALLNTELYARVKTLL